MNTLKVLIVEDHDVVSFGVIQTLKSTNKFKIEEKVAVDADQAYKCLQKEYFDIVLLDLILKPSKAQPNLKGGDELLREINKMNNSPKVIVLSKIDSLDMLDYIINTLGTDAYILKSRRSCDEIIPAIETVMNNETFYSPSVEKILRYNESLFEIDFRDRIILKALSEGSKQREIVSILNAKDIIMTVSAIEKRIRRLKARFNSNTIAQLIAIAVKEGII